MFENFHKSLKKIGEMSIKDITVKIHPVFKKNLVSLFFSRRRGRASKDLLHCEDYHTSQNQGSTELN